MKIINIDMNYQAEENSAVALGNFDGVHRGHLMLLKKNIKRADEFGLKSSVLLFKEHTDNLVKNEKKELLTDNLTKTQIMKDLGIDIIYFMEFNKEFMSLSPENFILQFLCKNLKAQGATLGFDYSFGKYAKGRSKDFLNYVNYFKFIEIIKAVRNEAQIISSTFIRDLIREGEIKKANDLLTRPFKIRGEVVYGRSIGKKLGFPTANIVPTDNYVIPKYGVYDTDIYISGNKFKAVTNIGINPSLPFDGLKIEAHILGFNREIYGEEIELDILRRIRGEKVFSDLDSLAEQIKRDLKEVIQR